MDSSWIDATLAWIAAHPVLAGAVIFLIAFCDAVIILGAIVPALPLLFAVGVFIGLGLGLLIGVVLTLLLFRSTLNMFSIIGVVMLMGLVTKTPSC